jgi:hypothetical protein
VTKEEIRSFLSENRAVAETQAQRWQGVDPSRLLAALDIIEVLTSSNAPASTGVPFRLDSLNFSLSDLYTDQYETTLELRAFLRRADAEAIHGYIKSHHTVMVLLSES